jgi:hypothetical protein
MQVLSMAPPGTQPTSLKRALFQHSCCCSTPLLHSYLHTLCRNLLLLPLLVVILLALCLLLDFQSNTAAQLHIWPLLLLNV